MCTTICYVYDMVILHYINEADTELLSTLLPELRPYGLHFCFTCSQNTENIVPFCTTCELKSYFTYTYTHKILFIQYALNFSQMY